MRWPGVLLGVPPDVLRGVVRGAVRDAVRGAFLGVFLVVPYRLTDANQRDTPFS
jgi:hypothetical protein